MSTLLSALLGRPPFSPGRPDAQKALTGLSDSLCRWLEHNPCLVLAGGNPDHPTEHLAVGLAEEGGDPTAILPAEEGERARQHLAGFWRDRRLVLICLRRGLTSAEFDQLYYLLSQYDGKGPKLRTRFFEEQTRGRMPHVSLLFIDDLPQPETRLDWPVRISLGWLRNDLNLLARCRDLATAHQVNWREQLLISSLQVPLVAGRLAEFFAHLELIAESIDNYDKDELVFSLLEELDESLCGDLCLQLCQRLERLPENDDASASARSQAHRAALNWVTRRLAEHMQELALTGPEHLHALVLNKVLLYEEIPQKMRPRVASLQVLTSFLSNPEKYFAEVESSHSPEVLETRLWRILEMLPKLVVAMRFDVARRVLDFSRRFGPSFELNNKPEVMSSLTNAVAGVLTEASKDEQAALMQTLPQLGRAGTQLLIELADHHNRSVRRTAFDALLKIGQPVVPVLFETLEVKKGWHYLRNMLLLLAQLNAGGPKVEKLFRRCLEHAEANVRKEALPGIARLLHQGAAGPVADALDDEDLEVRKRAAACLALTGIANDAVYQTLAQLLSSRECGEDLAVQIVASINRLKPAPPEDSGLETALLKILGVGGFMGFGGRKTSSSKTLRLATVQALGYVGGARSRKSLDKLTSDQDAALSAAAAEALNRLQSR